VVQIHSPRLRSVTCDILEDMSRSFVLGTLIGLVIGAAVVVFFAIGGLGGGSGLLIGLGFFVLPVMIWMLGMMLSNNPPDSAAGPVRH